MLILVNNCYLKLTELWGPTVWVDRSVAEPRISGSLLLDGSMIRDLNPMKHAWTGVWIEELGVPVNTPA